jgi:hypothetical protein
MNATPPFVPCLSLLLAAALLPWPPRGAAAATRMICPTITVECPEEPVRAGTPVNFKVKISGVGPESFATKVPGPLSYRWTVSAGTLLSSAEGRVTPDGGKAEFTAAVDTTGLPGNSIVTATVDVGGLDRSCSAVAACTTPIFVPREPHPIDYYGNIRFAHETALLDNLAIELQSDPTMHGYLECYGGRVGRRGEARARCERAKRYLTGRRGIAPDRIVLVDGGFREELTVGLWLLPPGTNFTPSPTVDPKDVRFTKATERTKSKKRAPRQRHSNP